MIKRNDGLFVKSGWCWNNDYEWHLGNQFLSETDSGFSYNCKKYPCPRLKNLDRRYRRNYEMSMIRNLANIKNHGLEKFLKNEEEKWKCKICGSGLSAHRAFCIHCKTEISKTEW